MDHEFVTGTLAKYATPEVMTVFGALLTAWVGWKAAAKGFGIVKGLSLKFGFLGITAALLFLVGTSGAFYGVGESICHKKAKTNKQPIFDGDTLRYIAVNSGNEQATKAVLEYAKAIDTKQTNADESDIIATAFYTLAKKNPKIALEFLKKSLENLEEDAIAFADQSVTHKKFPTITQTSYEEVVEAKPASETLMSFPASMGLFGGCIGAVIISIVMYVTAPIKK